MGRKMYFLKSNEIAQRAKDHMDSLPNGVFACYFDLYDNIRSSAQNRCLWGWLHIIALQVSGVENIKGEADELKDQLMMRLGHYDIVEIEGKSHIKIKSTTRLNKKEFNTLLDATQVLADNLGIKLPQGGYDD
jgi:hypothetical protein